MDAHLGDTFPDPAGLAERINQRAVEPNLTVADVVLRLQADTREFDKYEDLEDFAIRAYEQPGSAASELADWMLPIRNIIARELWSRELLVAVEIIDQLLFEALRRPGVGPAVRQVLDVLREARVDAAGFVVFAVHSLGMESASLDDLRTGIELIEPAWGIAVSSQTNSLERTIEFLDRVREQFGVDGVLPLESIRHWRRSRQTDWLERNPLLCVRVAEAAGTYFGNEALLLARLQVATSLVAMLAALQPGRQGDHRPTMSTSVINNRQTLDIHHYLVLSPGRRAGEEVDGDCVPISGVRPDLVAMSELRIDIDVAYWTANHGLGDQVQTAVWSVYRRYLRDGLDPARADDAARAIRRQFDALTFFQRSFSGQGWRDIISLSIAFELLLHDPSTSDTRKRVRKAIKGLFSAAGEGDDHAEAFARVYDARNKIVHEGLRQTGLDLERAHRAFVSAFIQSARGAGGE